MLAEPRDATVRPGPSPRRRRLGRWPATLIVAAVATVVLMGGCGVPNAGVGDFAGTWVGQHFEYDECDPACPPHVSGPYDVTIVIVQNGSDLVIDFDDGYCVYEGQAFFSSFVGEERQNAWGAYDCGFDDPLPILAELSGGVLSGRAYFEPRGDTYCLVDHVGCYAEFEVQRVGD
jgi:hypothetical protein